MYTESRRVRMRALWLGVAAAVVGVCAAAPAGATTWASAAVACPVCGTTGDYMTVMSYGSYIYQWPSKYQYIFWPATESEALYACRKCGYSCLMWDFTDLPAAKKDAVAAALKGVSFGQYDSYLDIPMPARLAAAEKVYGALACDDRFWCEFDRIKAYHLAATGDAPGAAEARRQALALAEKLAGAPGAEGAAKEYTFIAGAMKHFLGDDAGAIACFDAAAQLTYAPPGVDAAQAADVDAYLTALLQEYKAKLKSGEKVE